MSVQDGEVKDEGRKRNNVEGATRTHRRRSYLRDASSFPPAVLLLAEWDMFTDGTFFFLFNLASDLMSRKEVEVEFCFAEPQSFLFENEKWQD